MPAIFKLGETLIDFAQDSKLISAFHKLAEKWPQLDEVNDGRSLIQVLNEGMDVFNSKSVKDAFVSADLEKQYQLVSLNIAKFQGKLDKFGQRQVARLLDRLDRFTDPDRENNNTDPGLVAWVPLNTEVQAGTGAGFVLALNADARIEFEAGDRWPYAQDAESDPTLNSLLRLSVAGSGKADGTGKVPFPPFLLKVDAKAELSAGVAYYVQPKSATQIYGLALAEALASLPNPFEFDVFWKAFQRSDLKAINLYFDGGVRISADVGLALAAPIKDFGGVSASLNVRAIASRASKLQMSLRALAPAGSAIRPVYFTLSRDTATASEFGVNFDVELDPADFALKVATIVNQALDTIDDRIEPIRPFLTPGKWLKDRAATTLAESVRTLIKDEALEEALIADMRAALGREAASANLVTWIEDTLAGAVEAQAKTVRRGGDAAIDAVMELLKVKLMPLASGFGTDAAEASVRGEVGKLIDHYKAQLDDVVGERSDKLGDRFIGLLKKAADASGAASAQLDTPVKGVQALFDRYDAIVAKIRTATETAAKATLHISLFAETKRFKESEFLLAGTFYAGGEPSARLFKAMLEGSDRALDTAYDLMKSGGSAGSFDLEEDKSWLRRRSGRVSKSGGAIVFLGFKIAGSKLLSREADVRITATNDVEVNARFDITQTRNRLDGTQVVELSAPVVRSGRNSPSTLSLSLSLDRFEKDLRAEELQDLLDNLELAGLLRKEAIARGVAQLESWGMIRGSKVKVPASVRLDLAIDGYAAQRLLRLVSQPKGVLANTEWVAIIQTALYWLDKSGAWTRAQQEKAVMVAAELMKRDHDQFDNASLLLDWLFAQHDQYNTYNNIKKVWRNWKDGRDVDNNSELTQLFNLVGVPGEGSEGGRIQRLAYAISELREAVLATPQGLDPSVPDGWTKDRYEKAFATAARGFNPWIANSAKLLTLSDDLRPTLVAFIGLLTSLSGLDSETALTLVLAREEQVILLA